MYQLSREPLGIGRLLDGGIKLYLTGFTRVIVFALIWSVIFAAPNFGGGAEELLGATPEFGPGEIIAFLIATLISMFFYAAIFDRYNLIALGKDNSFIGCLTEGFMRGLPFVAYLILYALCVAFGTLALIIPGIWLTTMFALGGNAIVIEKQGPIEAMKTSWYLVRGNWWRVTVVLGVILLLHLMFVLALGIVVSLGAAGVINPANPDVLGQMNTYANITQIAFIATNAIIYPLWAATLTVIYHDLMLRKEGGDLAARVEDMDAEAGDDDGSYY